MPNVLVFLPWITIDAPISIDNYVLLPMKKLMEDEKYTDDQKTQIADILTKYKISLTIKNHSNPTLIYNSEAGPFAEENEAQIESIYDAMRVFAFSCMCMNEYYGSDRYYINASCFQIIRQKFEFGSDGVAFQSKRRDGSNLDGGYNYEHLKNYAAPWIRQCRSFRYSNDVIAGILAIKKNKASKYREIIASINWFMLSFTDDPPFDYKIEIPALLAAFEQLHHGLKGNTLEKDYFGNLAKKEGETSLGDWYNKFRDMRNEYLHGTKKTKHLKDFQHLFIGTIVFCLFLKKILVNHSGYVYSDDDIRTEKAILFFINNPDHEQWNRYLISGNFADIARQLVVISNYEESEQSLQPDSGHCHSSC